ncbi:MAG: class I SAM-dependent methyltransferase, partial [Lachnospiraceae bacterium]|nr:class I SAM-dependent methyltransferase [Lachnospiraceae bacterium]
KQGYQVTGIDFSKRSVNYARSSALKKGVDITYLYQNYLDMKLHKVFDFATMIYCDYGALSTSDRKKLMGRVYQHLKPGGKFLLDVFSLETYYSFQEMQTWEICNDGGFWREDAYVAIYGHYKYLNSVTLEQTTVISNTNTAVYYVWNTCFTKETLMEEAKEAGFKVCEFFGDVAGKPFHEDSPTIAVLLEK